MPQLILRNITISHDHHPLIENGHLTIESGDKVCIIGRNGVGKSTLLKCLTGDIELDTGAIEREANLRIALLPQTFPNDLNQTVRELVESRCPKNTESHKIDKALSLLELDPSAHFDRLSGGMKRRALLACALAVEPDILLLDEPTNHLDVEAITWLENFLKKYRQTVIFITHDRQLMQNIATHIVEIDLGRLLSWRGQYQKYLDYKEDLLRSEHKANVEFDKKLAQEEKWIRQGIKARRTRNEGRVRALKKMREQRGQRRDRQGTVKLAEHDIAYSGKIVFECDALSFQYHDEMIIKDFSCVIQRGDKIGIIGPNGSGKSTLINCLLGHLKPTSGTIKTGTKIDVAYFDQTQQKLDEHRSVQDNVGGGSTHVVIGNQQKHIMSYLQDFLFSPEQARKPLRMLSGGERNRVMLAKLLLKPCNVLVLDEPTNDLDVETLELLETALVEYAGTLLLVSHDREFLDNVVTSTFVLEGEGKVAEYVGGYTDWKRQCANGDIATTKVVKSQKSKPQASKTKLSYKEQRELELLPGKIEQLERAISELQVLLANPDVYKEQFEKIPEYQQQLQQLEQALNDAYERWEVLIS